MRLFLAVLLAKMGRGALLLGVVYSACSSSSGSVGDAGTAVYALELANYDPGSTPSSLPISNETQVFPLDTTAPSQHLSRAMPFALRVVYTRVGCWVPDPASWIAFGRPLPSQVPVRLMGISIEQTVPTRSNATASAATTELALSPAVLADAVAIFLPTYTNVKRITYTVSR